MGTVTTAKNKFGATPLHLACQFKHIIMVKVNIFRVHALFMRFRNLLSIILQTLIASGVPLEDRDDFGDMPIHYAAKSGGFSIIVTLVEAGVQPCVAGTYTLLEHCIL